jgi:hypothetical protein
MNPEPALEMKAAGISRECFQIEKRREIREASGLRPLERRFRADENAGKTKGFRAC